MAPRCSMVASCIPSSPDECTATPSWKVSHTPAALTQGRIPPQKVVSSRMTSAAGFSTLVANCSKSITTVLVERGIFTFSRRRRIPLSPPGRVLVVVVFQILYGQAEANALLDAEGGVGIEPQGIFGERAGEGPVAPEFVFWRIDATLELVRGEAVLLLEPPGMLHQLVGAPDLRLPRLGIRVPEEEVAREGHPVPELAADQRVNRDSELLPHKIQAPKLYGGMKLGAVVVEA